MTVPRRTSEETHLQGPCRAVTPKIFMGAPAQIAGTSVGTIDEAVEVFLSGKTVILPVDDYDFSAEVLRALGNAEEQVQETLLRARRFGSCA